MDRSDNGSKGRGAWEPIILIIDDDSSNLAVATNYLKDSNFEILVAEDGQVGLERARLAQPDLILLDVLMPNMDGFETCRRLKAEASTRDIPVIFMTALADTESKIKGFTAGAVDFVTKPTQREEVLARVGVHLRIRELTNNLKEANALLESKVEERTSALALTNKKLQAEIDERKHAEEALRKSEERYRALYDENPTMYFTLDAEGTVLSVNPFGVKQLGFTEEGLVGRSVLNIFHPDDKEAIQQQLADLLINPGHVLSWELRKIRKDGSILWVRESARAVQGGDHQTMILVVCEDITERKTLEAQLRQAVKMEAIGTLAGGVAHDFNNLMTVVTGYCALLLNDFPSEDPLRHKIEQIQRAGNRAVGLTNQLLAFSRKQVVQPKILDLNHVIKEMDKMLHRLIGEDIELITIPSPDLGCVLADPGLIDQVVMNLVINARDAMPQGGKLTIETANVYLDETYTKHHVEVKPGHYVLLAFSDTGCGMDQETLSHIFDPFFTTKETGKGTGLGLATVYGIVKQSGGNIWVFSEPGQGTTIKIYLPQAEGEMKTVASTSEATKLLLRGTETILLVEDDDMVRDFVSTSLKQSGHIVLEAHNGDEALSICTDYDGTIHLLVTDVIMPGMGGAELAKRIETLYPAMKVLYISGYTDNSIVHHGVLEEGMAFLQKPFTPHTLVSKVREVLDTSNTP